MEEGGVQTDTRVLAGCLGGQWAINQEKGQKRTGLKYPEALPGTLDHSPIP